jgi:hypothetical protein
MDESRNMDDIPGSAVDLANQDKVSGLLKQNIAKNKRD